MPGGEGDSGSLGMRLWPGQRVLGPYDFVAPLSTNGAQSRAPRERYTSRSSRNASLGRYCYPDSRLWHHAFRV